MTPATLVTLYPCDEPTHGDVAPVIVLGWEGTLVVVTARVWAVPFPQPLDGVTVIVPLFAPTVTVIEFVVPPQVFVHPAGSTHV